MPRARSCVAAVALAAIGSPLAPAGIAQAGEWTYKSDKIEDRAKSPFRFSTKGDLWIARFNRPARACDLGRPPLAPGGRPSELLPGGASSLCVTRDSSEVGFGTGIEVAFRLTQPLYLTAGIDILYTIAERKVLKNQVIVPATFGALVTFYEWSFRPIARFALTPMLYLTDDARDFMFGGEGGFAWRILDWGDLSFTVGYKKANSVKTWDIQLGLHPIP